LDLFLARWLNQISLQNWGLMNVSAMMISRRPSHMRIIRTILMGDDRYIRESPGPYSPNPSPTFVTADRESPMASTKFCPNIIMSVAPTSRVTVYMMKMTIAEWTEVASMGWPSIFTVLTSLGLRALLTEFLTNWKMTMRRLNLTPPEVDPADAPKNVTRNSRNMHWGGNWQ